MTSFVRTGIVTLFFCGVAFLAYWQLMLDHQAKTIKELQTLNEQMQQNLAEREAMIDRLSRNRRIAHVQVTDQMQGEAGAITQTSLQFIELDDKGAELARQTFTIPGNVLFVDAWTVKFDPEHVAEGHPLMGETLVLLRRICPGMRRRMRESSKSASGRISGRSPPMRTWPGNSTCAWRRAKPCTCRFRPGTPTS